MKLPDDRLRAALALGLSLTLAGCGLAGGNDRPAAVAGTPLAAQRTGPAADYPIVLGDPFTIEGIEYTPSDAMNHDEVGYASLDPDAGPGVTVAHKTLPLPSYVEVTSLETGTTILARVERRGPMTNARAVSLSPAAQAQLGVGDGAPVRVRRVNPPEAQRADLRAGREAPLRMATPETLLGVLRRRLPDQGSASLADGRKVPLPSGVQVPLESRPSVVAQDPAADRSPASPARRAANDDYALAPLARSNPAAAVPTAAATDRVGKFVVQAAAFSNKDNADRAAKALDGFVTPAGRFYRVRTGPYESRGQAEAALAKVRAAGYSDAKVSTAG